jgi:hypothetical protein
MSSDDADTSDGEKAVSQEDAPTFEGQVVFKGDFESSDDSRD